MTLTSAKFKWSAFHDCRNCVTIRKALTTTSWPCVHFITLQEDVPCDKSKQPLKNQESKN